MSLLLLSAAPPQTVKSFESKVVALADGDTITVLRDGTQVKIRLEGIDAPEKNQAFGNKAKAALSVHVFHKLVTVNATGTDRYRLLNWTDLTPAFFRLCDSLRI
jgi:micrococcal nuclease